MTFSFKIDKELLLKKSKACSYLVNEVFPADVPKGVRWAVAGEVVDNLISDLACGLPSILSIDDLTEKILIMEGTDHTFRQLPGGFWAVLCLPTELGGEHTLRYLVDPPGASGTTQVLPEIRSVFPSS